MREVFLALPQPRAYIIGETSLTNMMAQRADDPPRQMAPVFGVPKVVHGMGIGENPAALADVLRLALSSEP